MCHRLYAWQFPHPHSGDNNQPNFYFNRRNKKKKKQKEIPLRNTSTTKTLQVQEQLTFPKTIKTITKLIFKRSGQKEDGPPSVVVFLKSLPAHILLLTP